MFCIGIDLSETGQQMQGGVWVLTKLFHTISLQLVDVHIVLDEISNPLIVTNLEIYLIAYFSMIREVLLAILIDCTTIGLATIMEKNILVCLV